MLEDIQAAALLGFFLASMVGPVFFVLIETSITRGFRAAISFDAGVIVSDVFFIILAYFTSYQLLEDLSNEPGLYVFGGVLLAAYGLAVFVRPTPTPLKPSEKLKTQTSYINLFIKGFLLNIINIGTLVFWLGLIVVVGPNLKGSPTRFLVFFGFSLLTFFLLDICKIILSKKVKNYLTKKNILKIRKTVGIIIMVFGLVLTTKGFLPKDQLNPSKIIEEIAQ